MAQLTDFVVNGIDKQMYTGMLLVDLQKAFDTFNHVVFLEQMKCFGVRTSLINGLSPNRTFSVCIDIFSEAGTLRYSVTQCSILGPLLFLLYVNDLPQSLKRCLLFVSR